MNNAQTKVCLLISKTFINSTQHTNNSGLTQTAISYERVHIGEVFDMRGFVIGEIFYIRGF